MLSNLHEEEIVSLDGLLGLNQWYSQSGDVDEDTTSLEKYSSDGSSHGVFTHTDNAPVDTDGGIVSTVSI
jgi:hypothetical protein